MADYLSADMIHDLKKCLFKTKMAVEVQVHGKRYMERKGYRSLKSGKYRPGRLSADIKPVYGVIQLMSLFADRIERVRIMSASQSELKELSDALVGCSQNSLDCVIKGSYYVEVSPKRGK